MKLLALLIGLIVERLATNWFHLRELRWLDRIIDIGFDQQRRFDNWPAVIPVGMLVVALTLPVILIRAGIGDSLYDFPYLILAITVLFFSLGPKDIGREIDEYCRSLESEDDLRIQQSAQAITEADVFQDPEKRDQQVEAAVCIQANNRLFAVIFWFIVLGPVGAWLYRITDLVRRRAVQNNAGTVAQHRSDDPDMGVFSAAGYLHGWFAWIPARATAIGFGLAGSFDHAKSAWRAPPESKALSYSERSEQLLARVGTAALAVHSLDGESNVERAVRGVTLAHGLVLRQLFIWAAVIATMTLYG